MLDAPTMTLSDALDVLRPHAPFSVEAFYRRSYEETVFVKTQAGKTIMAIDNPFGEAFAVILNGAEAQAAEIEQLREAATATLEDEQAAHADTMRLLQLRQKDLASRDATIAEQAREMERLREALTPSGETKYAYHGEFSWTEWLPDENGVDQGHERTVPWTTIKEIMAAISARAARASAETESHNV